MLSIHKTAYPRLRSHYTFAELKEFYTPDERELAFAIKHTREPANQISLLVLLKVAQRLGYLPLWPEIPQTIISHITQCVGYLFSPSLPDNYDGSGNRSRHIKWIRSFLGIRPLGEETYEAMRTAALEASKTKEHLADIINVMLEELIRQHFELPGFSRLMKTARWARGEINARCLQQISEALTIEQKNQIDQLLDTELEQGKSWWFRLKQEPSAPTINNIKTYVDYVIWLKELYDTFAVQVEIPAAKLLQFYYEAYAADRSRMKEFTPAKRYAYTVILLEKQMGIAYDSVAHMFIRQVNNLHNKAKTKLKTYYETNQERVGQLLTHLQRITRAFQSPGSKMERFEAIKDVMPPEPQFILDQCDEYLAYVEDNYLLCLPGVYQSKRSAFFKCIGVLSLESSSQDRSLLQAIEFIISHRSSRKPWIPLPMKENHEGELVPIFTLDWIPDKWRKLVTGKSTKGAKVDQVHRKYFELCVFSELRRQFQSGDTYIRESDVFDDYRKQLISWEKYYSQIQEYEVVSGIPVDPDRFVQRVKSELLQMAQKTDAAFPENRYARMEAGELIMPPLPAKVPHPQYEEVDQLLKMHLKQVSILDVLVDSEKWLDLSSHFHTITGWKSKIPNYDKRFITSLFCYGCLMGPTETARSIPGVSRKQIAWLNTHHITEERLDEAITKVINAYNKFRLPKFWGSGKSVAADGTKWDIYEQNLLAEYHIRYGSYGGIGYYHVSDTYIALFSHFIPCGVYEAVYLLDALIKNQSDIQPDTVHGDTHSQSVIVFALAYLLGIKLMPRIRNLKELTFFRPDKQTRFQHVDALFSDTINWNLIKTHLSDMLRVVLSIKSGNITPSTILRRLGTHSRKNKLYFAFRELGRAVRTSFCLQFIQDIEVRKLIRSVTNINEEFHDFTDWIAFANKGIIPENLRHEQTKMIKYNHLVANLTILYNVNHMTRVLNELAQEGYNIDPEVIKDLAPYRTEHIKRFGSYSLNMQREAEPLVHQLHLQKSP